MKLRLSNLLTFFRVDIFLVIIMLVFTSCEYNEVGLENQVISNDIENILNNLDRKLVENGELSDSKIKNFQDAGFGGSTIRVFETIDKITNETYYEYEIDGDAFISDKQLEEISLNKIAARSGQWRTTNLVANNQTIPVWGYNLDNHPNVKQGLINAVANYNALNIGLTFDLNFDTIHTYYDSWKMYRAGIKVTIDYDKVGAGGRATFPGTGGVFSWVYIFDDTNDLSLNLNEHIITHEIGHCLGMRHTDYFNRSLSCGAGGNEGSAGVGAIHIPGTPANTIIDMNSVFLSCFDYLESGELSDMDVLALETLY